jgi:hypothetical protein
MSASEQVDNELDMHLRRIRQEIKRIEEESFIAAEKHYASETPWFRWTYWLGIPASLLAAVSSTMSFAQVDKRGIIVGVVSMIVAILAGMLTYLDPSKKANAHHASAKSYEALFRKARLLHRVVSLKEDADLHKLEADLNLLLTEYIEISKNSLPIPGEAYKIMDNKRKMGKEEVVRLPDN